MPAQATCFSRPQVDACISRMTEAAEAKFARTLPLPPAASTWVCLDFGDVVCHVFTPADRSHYDLESLYRRATEVPLPFETQRG